MRTKSERDHDAGWTRASDAASGLDPIVPQVALSGFLGEAHTLTKQSFLCMQKFKVFLLLPPNAIPKKTQLPHRGPHTQLLLAATL